MPADWLETFADRDDLLDLLRTLRIEGESDRPELARRLEWHMNNLAGHRNHDDKALRHRPGAAEHIASREEMIRRLDRMIAVLRTP